VKRVRKDHAVSLALSVRPDRKDHAEKPVLPDHAGRLVRRDPKATRVMKVHKVLRVRRVLKEKKVMLAPEVCAENRVKRVIQVLSVQRGRRV
jgi:hypothetical protein